MFTLCRVGARMLLFAALVCVSGDSWAKVDAKFERWLGRNRIAVLETGDPARTIAGGSEPFEGSEVN